MQLWQIAESYSDPFLIYDILRKSGMTFFTLTDHNSIDGCLLLKERYGEEVLISTESTVTFPEDGCKIHLLIYGITEGNFAEIQRLRKDIYTLREYLRERDIAHSVAHATYPVQGEKLTVNHLEKLILLFDTFEVINGARNQRDNQAWKDILKRLTPDCIESLIEKHNIMPFGERSWIKGFTGGSDDHAAVFTGITYTEARAADAGNFLEALKRKETEASGRHGDYRSLAYQIYKITYDYSQQNGNGSRSLMTQLSERLFEKKPLGLLNRVRIRRMKRQAQKSGNDIYHALHGLAHGVKRKRFRLTGGRTCFCRFQNSPHLRRMLEGHLYLPGERHGRGKSLRDCTTCLHLSARSVSFAAFSDDLQTYPRQQEPGRRSGLEPGS